MIGIYGYGCGDCDQLPVNYKNPDIMETRIPLIIDTSKLLPNFKISQIACGGMQTLLLSTTGEVFSFGGNDAGELGRLPKDGASDPDTRPAKVEFNIPITNVEAGDSHSVAYNTDKNILYTWGGYKVRTHINIYRTNVDT